MTRDAKSVLDAALALPTKTRAEIAERLLRSLDGPELSAAEQEEVDTAWESETRRLKEIDDGTAELIPFEQVMADVKDLLKGQAGTRSIEGPRRAGSQNRILRSPDVFRGRE